MDQYEISVRWLGNSSLVSSDVLEVLEKVTEMTSKNEKLVLVDPTIKAHR
jgi:undecaprenyl pyrophosphate synthase